MSKYKSFQEFRKKVGEYSIAEHLILENIGDKKFDIDQIKKDGLDIKLFINGVEGNFQVIMDLINKHFNTIEKEVQDISKEEIKRLFREKVSTKLYDILEYLDLVDNVVKSCVSWYEE